MNWKIRLGLTFLIGIIGGLLIGFVSATYPGESQTYPNTFGSDNLVWTIIENTSELSVLPVVLVNTTNITITIPSDMPPNSFKIVFLDNYTQEVVNTIVVSAGGSGSHSTKRKIVNNTIIKEVEVPNYISVENKTIEVVNNTITKWEVTKEITGWTWVLAGGVFLVLLIFLYFAYRLGNKYNDERGYEENE